MSTTTRPKSFSPETIAQIAVVVLSQPVNLTTGMSLSSACRVAHNILVAAERFNLERESALDTASKVAA
jgi:hypothetical protein